MKWKSRILGEENVILSIQFSDQNSLYIKLNIEELKIVSRTIAKVHLNCDVHISDRIYSGKDI